MGTCANVELVSGVAVNLPRIPQAYHAVTPMDALAKTPEELLPVLAKSLNAYFRRTASATANLAGIHRTDSIWVCGTRDEHGKTARSAALRQCRLLGVPEVEAHLTWVQDVRRCDSLSIRDYSVFLADFSTRAKHPPGTDIMVLVLSRKYHNCWYGTHLPYDRLVAG